jgi:small subunit ribosomal protein S12
MPTINQLVKRRRRKKPNKDKTRKLQGAPFAAGTIVKIGVMLPKKPNSANRKVGRARLHNGEEVPFYVPGEGHNLQIHGHVLIRGGRTRDCPGHKLRVVRGSRDCLAVKGRKRSRSKYGAKKPAAT